MKTFIQKFATPAVTGLFLISATSGVALFFHWNSGLFHSMHEWLGMVLLLPFVFHAWRNRNALMGYYRRKTLLPALTICLLAATAFAVSSSTGKPGGNPLARTLPLLTQASIADLAPILQATPENLTATLRQRGLTVTSEADTLDIVAARANTPANQLLFALLPTN